MTESPIRTPSSVHDSSPSASPRERSPIITGVSALSSPTEASADVEEPLTTPPPPPPPPQKNQKQQQEKGEETRATPRAVVESLSDTDDDESGGNGSMRQRARGRVAQAPPQTSSTAPVHITAADYADRRRLLNHITYLSTQLQRAQLQAEDLTRATCILRGLCDGDRKAVEASVSAVDGGAASTTAAVLAARDEAEVQAALQAALAVFDPVIAQTQIYRLDDALAQMGLLREAELAQLQHASTALQEQRTLAARLAEEVAQLRRRTTTLEQQKVHAETQLTAASLEVQRLRHEELRLVQRVAGLQELAQDGTWMNGVRVVGATSAAPSPPLTQLVEEEETLARQALLLDIFWDPLLIAFDAGLTWMTDSAALRADAAVTARTTAAEVAEAEAERLSLAQAGVVVEPPPPSDTDLLLLRRQQEEVAELRARVQLLQDRNRVADLEKERLQFLYENEMRRSERMAQDHVAQLQQAYDEVVKDRQCIMQKLKGEVEEQLRLAFEDGRAYEKNHGVRSRSRPSKKLLRSSNAVT